MCLDRIRVGLAVTLLAPASVAAQSTRASLDAGAVRVTYSDTATMTGASVSPGWRVESARALLALNATIAQFADAGTSLQGAAAASLFTPRFSALMGELAGAAGGSNSGDGSSTSKATAVARLHAGRANAGVWLGAGGGAARDAVESRSIRLAELGGWARAGVASFVATVTPTRLGGGIEYTDADVTATIERARVELWANGGVRSGARSSQIIANEKTWGSVGGVFWLFPFAALTTNAGRYVPDYAQGFPGGAFISAGVRIGRAPSRVMVDAPSVAAPVSTVISGPVTDFQMRRTSNGVVIRVTAPGARTVEITGDFTGWRPASLSRTADGQWVTTVAAAPGTYEYNLRVDGEFALPPGATTVRDEFGGESALLVVD